MARYRIGRRLPQKPGLRAVKRRALWAARMAGVKSDALRGIRWQFVAEITDTADGSKKECGGLCFRRGGATWIYVIDDRHIGEYVCHELAHAILWGVEAHTDGNGAPVDDHGPLWTALFRILYTWYEAGVGGPPKPRRRR